MVYMHRFEIYWAYIHTYTFHFRSNGCFWINFSWSVVHVHQSKMYCMYTHFYFKSNDCFYIIVLANLWYICINTRRCTMQMHTSILHHVRISIYGKHTSIWKLSTLHVFLFHIHILFIDWLLVIGRHSFYSLLLYISFINTYK